MRRGLVGHDIWRHAAARELRQYVGGVAFERQRSRDASLLPPFDALEGVIQIVGALVDVARGQSPLDPGGIDLDDKRNPAIHCHRQRLSAAHAAETSGDDQAASQASTKVTPRQLRQRLIRSLKNALRADVDPAARSHLSVHRQPAILEIAETLPRRPRRHQQGIGNDDSGRPRMSAEDGDRFPRLYDERFVMLEAMEGVDDGVEGGPAAGGTAGPTVDDEVVRAFGDVGVEVVHQHAERGFLRPSLAGDRRASRRADMAAEGAHRAECVRESGASTDRSLIITIMGAIRHSQSAAR